LAVLALAESGSDSAHDGSAAGGRRAVMLTKPHLVEHVIAGVRQAMDPAHQEDRETASTPRSQR
jgi:hypothetical protein